MPDDGLASWFPHPIRDAIPTEQQALYFDQVRRAFASVGLGVSIMTLVSAPRGRTGRDPVTYEYYLRVALDMALGRIAPMGRYYPDVIDGLGDTPLAALDACLEQVAVTRQPAVPKVV